MTMSRAGDGYHHGSLRTALIEATEALLAERGADGFSLREVARRAGVSPAAPAHHFGDATGLLTAVAAGGFAELTRRLEEGQARGVDSRDALLEQGLAYVRFALERPGLFRLMFRSAQLRSDGQLAAHGAAAYGVLSQGVARAAEASESSQGMSPAQHEKVIALWALVHGYAHLAIAGKLSTAAPTPLHGCDGCASTPPSSLVDGLRPVLEAVLSGLFVSAQRPAVRRRSRTPR